MRRQPNIPPLACACAYAPSCACSVCCSRPVQALEQAEAALADDWLSSGDRLALQRRVLRLGALPRCLLAEHCVVFLTRGRRAAHAQQR